MGTIILDLAPNTHKNSIYDIKQMIDAIVEIDTHKHEIIFKHQMFMKSDVNIVLDRVVFAKAYDYAKNKGYKTTASVFDLPSLAYLMQFEIPFIKIACNEKYYWLIDEIPRKYMIYASRNKQHLLFYHDAKIKKLSCIPHYPAKIEEYEDLPKKYISDHTAGLDLWHEYKPEIWEKHYVLHKNKADNPDSGEFAITPMEMRLIL